MTTMASAWRSKQLKKL